MARAIELVTLRCTPERATRIGAGLLASPPASPTLVIAELDSEAILLGRHQRFASALEAKALGNRTVLRRNSGGRTIAVGAGTAAVLLAVPDFDALLDARIGPEKFLNRYVRGLNAGLTRAGAPGGAHYFGRDFISASQQQLAVIGQDNGPRAALFEAFIAASRPLALEPGLNGYLEHGDPRVGGPPHGTLGVSDFAALAEAIAQGYASTYAAELKRADPALPELELPAAREDESGWTDSGVADVPIGFVEALVQRDGDRVRAVRLRGDLLAPSFVMAQLERDLAGCKLDFAELGRRVDAAFHQPGAFVFGMRELRILAEAVLAAAGALPA